MKLMAGRQYKNDLSDIIGVLIEQEERDEPLNFEKIQKAVVDLYDSYDKIPEASRTFIEAVYKKEDLHEFYKQCRELEQENKDVLVGFQEDYPGVLNGDNLADILKAASEAAGEILTMDGDLSLPQHNELKKKLTEYMRYDLQNLGL